MMPLDGVAQRVDGLLQGLDALGDLKVVLRKRLDGQGEDPLDGFPHDFGLLLRVRGEAHLLVVHFLRDFGQVDRVVADALQISDDVQQFGYLPAVRFRQAARADLDQEAPQLVLIAVDAAF